MDVIITSYFTGQPDAQRGVHWQADESAIEPLAQSVKKRAYRLIVLNDCFEPGIRDNGAEFVTAPLHYQPYFGRWDAQYRYLKEHPEIKRAFLVDSTDVVMQYDPFYDMSPNIIYSGDEFEVLGNEWMVEHSKYPPVRSFIAHNTDMLLLNCGVVGGSRKDLMKICNEIVMLYIATGKKPQVEMPIYNYVLRTMFGGRISRGRHVTTIFKSYEKDAGGWFKHK